jgi:hypothetical protein
MVAAGAVEHPDGGEQPPLGEIGTPFVCRVIPSGIGRRRACPVSLNMARQRVADLRRARLAETPSRRPSYLIWSVVAILSAVSHSSWSAMAILSGEVDGDRGGED